MSKEKTEKKEETVAEASIRMAGALETALKSGNRFFYADLTDNQLIGFTVALSGYLEDLQHEWTRREMLKEGEQDV